MAFASFGLSYSGPNIRTLDFDDFEFEDDDFEDSDEPVAQPSHLRYLYVANDLGLTIIHGMADMSRVLCMYGPERDLHFAWLSDASAAAEHGLSTKIVFFDPKLVGALARMRFVVMKPVQRALFSILVVFAVTEMTTDVVVEAPTASGKTLAYVAPIVQYCSIQRHLERVSGAAAAEWRGPFAVIVVPTHILVKRVYQLLKDIVSFMAIKDVVRVDFKFGALNSLPGRQIRPYDIVVLTTSKIEFVFDDVRRVTGRDLDHLEFLVVDEFDTTLDQNIMVTKKLVSVAKKRLFFSATYANGIIRAFVDPEKPIYIVKTENERVARATEISATARPIGALGQADVTHRIVEVKSCLMPSFCKLWMPERDYTVLDKAVRDGVILGPLEQLLQVLGELRVYNDPSKKVLVFVKRHDVGLTIVKFLNMNDCKAFSLTSKFKSHDQDKILQCFERGDFNIIVASVLMARGVDYPIDVVVNYDLPERSEDFIHRCGRTGRHGNGGAIYTFIDPSNPRDYSPTVIQSIRQMPGVNFPDFKS